MKKFLFTIFFFCAFILIKAQNTDGKLYIHTLRSDFTEKGILGQIEYPSGQYSFVDSADINNLTANDTSLYAAGESIKIYNLSSNILSDSIGNTDAWHLGIWDDQLLVGSNTSPHFRAYDISQDHNPVFSLDTSKVPFLPADMIVSDGRAFLLMNQSMIVVDLVAQDTVATFFTEHPFPFGGFNTFMVAVNDKLYVDVEYATGALRFSMISIDKNTLQVDSLFHREGLGNFQELVAVNESVHLMNFDTHYDIGDDSLYVSEIDATTFFQDSVRAVEYDDRSETIFLSYSNSKNIRRHHSNAPVDTVSIPNVLNKALFIPDSVVIIQRIQAIESEVMVMAPNPVGTEISVKLLKDFEPGFLKIFSFDGRLILTKSVFKKEELNLISLEKLVAGLYFLEWNSGGKKWSSGFVKM